MGEFKEEVFAMKENIKLNREMIKSLRLNMLLSQNTLANSSLDAGCPLSLATIKRAESGKSVSFRTVINYAAYFNVDKKVILAIDKHKEEIV